MNKSPRRTLKIYSALLFLFLSVVFPNTRVAFSRPGALIRTPSLLINSSQDEYHVGFSTELINTTTFNSSSAIFFKGISHKGYHYGFAYSTHAKINQNDNNPLSDLSFHFGSKIYSTDNMQINMGINDVLYSPQTKHELSLSVSLLNSGIILGKRKRFGLQTALGFGTGKINQDSHNSDTNGDGVIDYEDDISHEARFFFGLNIKTPYLKERGGVNLLLDFDGSGTHLGATIPAGKQLEVNVGITNFQNIVNFNQYKVEGSETIFPDSPGISFGIGFKIKRIPKSLPRIADSIINFSASPNECVLVHTRENHNNPIAIDTECEEVALNQFVTNINKDFTILNDSIIFMQQELETQKNYKTQQDFEIKTLEESINIQYLKQVISVSELNIAMKHMIQSLQYYYEEQYILALDEVDKTIKRFPKLAIAYARKGSIYYQLGDLKQATIYWNIALKHDPEYKQVQAMLSSIKTNIDNIRR